MFKNLFMKFSRQNTFVYVQIKFIYIFLRLTLLGKSSLIHIYFYDRIYRNSPQTF